MSNSKLLPNTSIRLSDKFLESIAAIPEEYKAMSIVELRHRCKPNEVDYELKRRFWEKFYNLDTEVINLMDLVDGLCSIDYIHKKVFPIPARLTWLLTPAQKHHDQMDALLQKAIDRYTELLDIEIVNAKGQPNAKAAAVLLQTIKNIEERIKGLPVQRIKSETININAKLNVTAPEHMKELDGKILDLETKMKKIGPVKGDK